MTTRPGAGNAGGISDTAVRKSTGKGWTEWFAILDNFDVKKHGHKAAAQFLYDRHVRPGWWCQMITVAYEQEKGLRQKHETPEGYQVSGSRIMAVPLAILYRYWEEATFRRRWLKERVTIRKATPNKSMRITWSDGETSVEANFYAKGKGKSQIAIQHRKLKSAAAAKRMKAFWAKRLDKLRSLLEAGRDGMR